MTGDAARALPWLPTSDDERPFLHEGLRRGDLVWLARDLLRQCPSPSVDRLLVLTEDRALVATAVLASLAGGPELIFPHSMSAALLPEIAGQLPFDAVLTEASDALPLAIPRLSLSRAVGHETGQPLALGRPWDEPFLHLYTGGSSGRPRRWSKTPANLLAEASYHAGRFGVGAQDCILGTVPPYHIYGLLFSVLLPLVSAARVCGETVFFPREVADRGVAAGCTVLVSVPAHYRSLAAAGAILGPLRLAFSSGAPLEEQDAAAFLRMTSLGVTEVYGSTETGGIATRCRAAGETSWTAFGPLRWQIASERLCVASPFLSPELPRDDAGFFCTGDRAEPAPTPGGFALLGRADGIIKVGGKRVDLGEVEEKLRGIPGVQDALVFALPDASGRGETIAALAVAALTAEEILERLRPRLPPYALPRRLRRVEQLPPLTTAGKRDREAALRLLV